MRICPRCFHEPENMTVRYKYESGEEFTVRMGEECFNKLLAFPGLKIISMEVDGLESLLLH